MDQPPIFWCILPVLTPLSRSNLLVGRLKECSTIEGCRLGLSFHWSARTLWSQQPLAQSTQSLLGQAALHSFLRWFSSRIVLADFALDSCTDKVLQANSGPARFFDLAWRWRSSVNSDGPSWGGAARWWTARLSLCLPCRARTQRSASCGRIISSASLFHSSCSSLPLRDRTRARCLIRIHPGPRTRSASPPFPASSRSASDAETPQRCPMMHHLPCFASSGLVDLRHLRFPTARVAVDLKNCYNCLQSWTTYCWHILSSHWSTQTPCPPSYGTYSSPPRFLLLQRSASPFHF